MTIHPRHWPWWSWAVLVILLLVVGEAITLALFRRQGRHELDQALAELAAKGMGSHPADLVKLAPPVDAVRQEQAWKLVQRIGDAPWLDLPSGRWSAMDQRYAPGIPRGATKPIGDQDLTAFIDASQDECAAWQALQASGPVVLSGFGWLAQDLPRPAELDLVHARELRQVRIPTLRALGRAFAVRAYVAADPRDALAAIDQVVAAAQPSMLLTEVLALTVVNGMRDDAWLDATLRGTDPAPWIARLPDLALAAADGFAAERMLYPGTVHQDLVRGTGYATSLGASAMSSASTGGVNGIGLWLGGLCWGQVADRDLAFAFTWEGRIEERLRRQAGSGPDLSSSLTTALHNQSWHHPLSGLLLFSVFDDFTNALQADARARRMRLAAALVQAWRAGDGLPADDAGVVAALAARHLPTDLPAATAGLPAIRYTRVAPGRFRLWSDPATPATDLLPAGSIDAPTPTAGPWSQGRWWLELELAAIGK